MQCGFHLPWSTTDWVRSGPQRPLEVLACRRWKYCGALVHIVATVFSATPRSSCPRSPAPKPTYCHGRSEAHRMLTPQAIFAGDALGLDPGLAGIGLAVGEQDATAFLGSQGPPAHAFLGRALARSPNATRHRPVAEIMPPPRPSRRNIWELTWLSENCPAETKWYSAPRMPLPPAVPRFNSNRVDGWFSAVCSSGGGLCNTRRGTKSQCRSPLAWRSL